MSEKTYMVNFTRIELTWLMRQLESGRDRADGIIKSFSGELVSAAQLSQEQKDQLDEAVQHKATLNELIDSMQQRLKEGERERLAIVNMRKDLEEARELAEEQSAKDEAAKRIEALPEQEDYRIEFDRATLKFTLKLVENDLHKFRSQIIPTYEKADPGDFTDPIQTKSFWVNKARKSKDILDGLKTKLERRLS